MKPGREQALERAWEFSGSSHHSARPNGSAGCPQTWSSGSGSHRSSPPHSNRTCLGKSRRFQICRRAGGKGWLRAADCLPPQESGLRSRAGDQATGAPTPSPQLPTPRTSEPRAQRQDEWGQDGGKDTGAGSCYHPERPTPGPSSLLQRFSEELVGTMIVLKYR